MRMHLEMVSSLILSSAPVSLISGSTILMETDIAGACNHFVLFRFVSGVDCMFLLKISKLCSGIPPGVSV